MIRRGTVGLFGVAVLGISPAALAADIPGDRSTKAIIKVGAPYYRQGTFEQKGDSDWYRVTLKEGQNYAFAGLSRNCIRSNLRNDNGEVLKSAIGQYANSGFEFRPAMTGHFFVEALDAKEGSCLPARKYPVKYDLEVARDVRGDVTTDATMLVGKRINNVFNWSRDADYFRVKLNAGEKYTFGAAAYPRFFLSLRDAKDNIVVSGSGVYVFKDVIVKKTADFTWPSAHFSRRVLTR